MGRLKIGWASRDITTDEPVNIPANFSLKLSQGVLDPICVTALVIDNDADMVIFLSADVVVIRSGLLDEVRRKVAAQNPAIPVGKIIMNATHAHTTPSHFDDTPGAKGLPLSIPSEVPHEGIEIASSDTYRDFLSTRAAAAVCQAFDTRSSGGIAYGYGYAVVAHSRRVVYFDDTALRPGAENDGRRVNGHAVMYGETHDDQFSHYEAGADHLINILFTFDQDNKLTGAMLNIPCPSQNSEAEPFISADFWHDIRTALRQTYGDNLQILPQSAAGGDLSPRILHYKQAQDRRFGLKYGWTPDECNSRHLAERCARKDIAGRVAKAFDEVYSWAGKEIFTDLPITHLVTTVALSKRLITDDESAYARSQLAKLEAIPLQTEGDDALERLRFNSNLVSQRKRFQHVVSRYETQKIEPRLPMELHVLRIGDVAFATNRFELFMDYMHRIQARSPFTQTFIIQLTGVPGAEGGTYLATSRAAAGKGYSACLFCNHVSPEGGQELVEETLTLLERIADQATPV